MKKFFVAAVAVLMFGTISASAQSASQPAKPKPANTTASAQKAPAATPATKPATPVAKQKSAIAAASPKPAAATTPTKPAATEKSKATNDTGKPKKTHRMHRKAKAQSPASMGTTDKAATKAKSGKN